ncbi:MAG: acyl-CoA dehydrogenase family protein [Cyanobacteria bacterium P01_A01_bin.40]
MINNLQQIESFLHRKILPLANQIDVDPDTLKLALKQMGDRSWLALKVPPELGGSGLNEAEYGRIQISLARVSGALTFLQTQHQSAVAKLAQSSNSLLQQKFLPLVAKGDTLIGVGFSHLRRPGLPMMSATETADGYFLTGEVPWITGYGFFDHFILGATLPDGRELYGLMPLTNQVQQSGGTIAVSAPMKLLAVSGTNTVSATISQWFLPDDRLVSINPSGAIHQSSRRNVLSHGFFALGTAYAGLDILLNIASTKKLEFIQESWQTLHQELQLIEQKAIASVADEQIDYHQKLQLRSKTIDIAQRCSLAAVVASSGAANYQYSSASRIYREAMLFTVSGQTTDVMQASLNSLLR